MKFYILSTGLFLTVFETLSFAQFPGQPKGITVVGECHKTIVPDRSKLVVTADVLESDVKSAGAKVGRINDRVREAIQKLSLENLELKTVEYSVFEEKEYEKNKTVSKGFRARMGLQVITSSVSKMGEVIQIAAREQVKDVSGLVPFLSEELKMKEHLACLEEATANARTRAEKIAKSLGAKLGGVTYVQEEQSSEVRPFEGARMMKAQARGGFEAPTVESGTETLTVRLTVNFGI